MNIDISRRFAQGAQREVVILPDEFQNSSRFGCEEAPNQPTDPDEESAAETLQHLDVRLGLEHRHLSAVHAHHVVRIAREPEREEEDRPNRAPHHCLGLYSIVAAEEERGIGRDARWG